MPDKDYPEWNLSGYYPLGSELDPRPDLVQVDDEFDYDAIVNDQGFLDWDLAVFHWTDASGNDQWRMIAGPFDNYDDLEAAIIEYFEEGS